MQVKKQQLEPDMEQRTGSTLGEEYIKAVYCHPAYFSMWLPHAKCLLNETQAGIKLLGEISTTSDMQMTHPNGIE